MDVIYADRQKCFSQYFGRHLATILKYKRQRPVATTVLLVGLGIAKQKQGLSAIQS